MSEKFQYMFEILVVLLLILATAFVLWAQRVGLTTSIEVLSDDRFIATPLDDRANEGKSVATLRKEGDSLIVECEIVRSTYQWPYCEAKFNVDPEVNGKPGIDFSNFQRVEITAYYNETDELNRSTNSTVRFQMRNFNPIYSDLEIDSDSLKYNGIEYRPEGKKTVIPMDSLNVYSWWIAAHPDLPIELQEAEFDDVWVLELATGNNMRAGKHEIVIEKIEFIGPLFNSVIVNRVLLYNWVGVIAFLLLVRILTATRHLQVAKLREAELKSINRLLNVKKEELEKKATRDPLTGALNRNGLESFLLGDLNNEQICVSVIFMDIDHFKRINDTYGHGFGDEVLRRFVDVVTNNTRGGDLLARWGGEEFVLLLPNTNLSKATEIAEKLRRAIADKPLMDEVNVTSSFGVAELKEETFESFFKRADDALYRSKETGRNKVSVAANG
ncbi:GGDEF domain-containing protein [Salinibius halmophilus]|uniref:GGDEF domain-containing protein n=1 Tax=Salinibius halmophilus TaxID=1853216 RepID=UPI001314D399|nr:GGDEF domain-containing protein [Salinibius halmophilus]